MFHKVGPETRPEKFEMRVPVVGISDVSGGRTRHVAILSGTVEVHRPLYRHLTECIEEPVRLVDCEVSDRELREILSDLALEGPVWVLPSNEVVLNRAAGAIARLPSSTAVRVQLPGRALLPRPLSAAELSDKAVVHRLLSDTLNEHFGVVRGVVVYWRGLEADLRPAEDLRFPVVVKPATKDRDDGFTHLFAAKLAVAGTPGELTEFLFAHSHLLLGRELLIQELAVGEAVSWCGYITRDRMEGYRVTSLIRSPRDLIGGTTTLARTGGVDDGLGAAVGELARVLRLDGIFEIEFIEHQGQYQFFHEVNPRPWLQVAAVLGETSSIFTRYLETKGFHAGGRPLPPAEALPGWGSIERHLTLNRRGSGVARKGLMSTLRSDVRLGRFFSGLERFTYLGCVLVRLLRSMVRLKSPRA